MKGAGPAIAIACVLAGTAGLAGARPRMVKGPYLQGAAPTSITVMWQLDEPRPARLLIEGPGGTREQAVPAARISEALISELEPGTRYRYRVIVDDLAWEGQLATAPPAGKDVPVTFAVLGDTRYGAEPHRRIVDRIVREAPDFVLGTGDVVDDGSRQDQWQQFFDIEAPLLRDRVFYPAVGNHDRQGRGRTADAYRAYFSVPAQGGEAERYYAFTYASVRVLVLDSNIYSFALADQTAWIERELIAARQDAGVRHIFAVMHHPPFSISLHGGAKDLRERWTPLFERYGVGRGVLRPRSRVHARRAQRRALLRDRRRRRGALPAAAAVAPDRRRGGPALRARVPLSAGLGDRPPRRGHGGPDRRHGDRGDGVGRAGGRDAAGAAAGGASSPGGIVGAR